MIKKVAKMPCLPNPLIIKDFKDMAKKYDKLIFDFDSKGAFMPLIWLDGSKTNYDGDTFGIYSYVGHYAQRQKVSSHEAINCVTAVLSATLVGINKQHAQYDFVDMLRCYFNKDNGVNMFLNTPQCKTGGSFWYETFPCVLLAKVIECYSNKELNNIFNITADKWLECFEKTKKHFGKVDFNYTAYDFSKDLPVYNGVWREPDGAAAIAYILFKRHFCNDKQPNVENSCADSKYLSAAKECLQFLSDRENSANYELLLPYGAYLAARFNRDYKTNYNVKKLVNDCFEGSDVRRGWGCVTGAWGDIAVDGLIGSTLDCNERWDEVKDFKHDKPSKQSGYAFTGNTFAFAGILMLTAKYDERFASDIGKWLLNLTNSARLFYPDGLPAKNQSCAFFKSDKDNVIAYEGLKKYWDGKSPYATGDAIRYSWGCIDLGIYGSSFVGFLAGSLIRTSDEAVLCWDLNKNDIQSDEQAYLLYNPYDKAINVKFEVSGAKCNCDIKARRGIVFRP